MIQKRLNLWFLSSKLICWFTDPTKHQKSFKIRHRDSFFQAFLAQFTVFCLFAGFFFGSGIVKLKLSLLNIVKPATESIAVKIVLNATKMGEPQHEQDILNLLCVSHSKLFSPFSLYSKAIWNHFFNADKLYWSSVGKGIETYWNNKNKD